MKKCSTCRYRGSRSGKNGCDFYLIKNRRRGCPVDNCTEYEKGEKIQLKTHMRAEVTPGRLRKTQSEYDQYKRDGVNY